VALLFSNHIEVRSKPFLLRPQKMSLLLVEKKVEDDGLERKKAMILDFDHTLYHFGFEHRKCNQILETLGAQLLILGLTHLDFLVLLFLIFLAFLMVILLI